MSKGVERIREVLRRYGGEWMYNPRLIVPSLDLEHHHPTSSLHLFSLFKVGVCAF